MTDSEIAARDARRDKFRAIASRVAKMTEDERLALVPAFGAVPTCEGRTLSLKNTMLAVLQNPGVSLVGGFRQWLRVGRCVRKGEHGLMIWIPLGAGKSVEAEGDGEGESVRFGTSTVFDISQTVVLEPAGGNQANNSPAVVAPVVQLELVGPAEIEIPSSAKSVIA